MLPWCLQWIWPVPLIIGMLFAPESPWWLVRKEKFAEAERAVKRLYRGDDKDIGSKTVAMMLRTDQLEKETSAGATFRQCFRGTDLRRTEVACVAFSCQILCGSVLSWNSSFFFVQAGTYTRFVPCTGLTHARYEDDGRVPVRPRPEPHGPGWHCDCVVAHLSLRPPHHLPRWSYRHGDLAHLHGLLRNRR